MVKQLDYEKVFNTLVKKTQEYITDNHLNSMVLGISGGIDSTIVAAICHEVSKNTGIPLIGRSLPIKNKEDEFSVSKLVGEAFCTNFEVVSQQIPYTAMLSVVGPELKPVREEVSEHSRKIIEGNIQARVRMNYLYALASIHKGLVMSTDNMTEYMLGFWTLHGDVGDFDPIQDLWKTEVYGLAKWISNYYEEEGIKWAPKDRSDRLFKMAEAIDESIALTPTDGLGISDSDFEQIGAKNYDEIDPILQEFKAYCEFMMQDKDFMSLSLRGKADTFLEDEKVLDIDINVVVKVINRHVNSEFKRKKSPIYIPRYEFI